ncbi:hypothetical protein LIER_26683 [Lithospermum erythrorhizon]|uniref:Uncharacterized protein n=1 Tax=Lithospermum erythrorhizon TaxID=34254 RepID=A0AAV3RCA2_LITER
MTGDKSLFSNITDFNDGSVTFGESERRKIIGKEMSFAATMESNMSYQQLEHLSRMELQNGGTKHYKKWEDSCRMKEAFLKVSGERL